MHLVALSDSTNLGLMGETDIILGGERGSRLVMLDSLVMMQALSCAPPLPQHIIETAVIQI